MTQLTLKNQIEPKLYNNKFNNAHKQNFKGAGIAALATTALQACDTNPVVGISVIDLFSAIGPNTISDLASTGVPSAMETFRRESSGLLVNCLIPSAIVFGVGKTINNMFFKGGLKGIDMSRSWANEDSINKLSDVYLASKGKHKAKSFVTRTLAGLEFFKDKDFVPFTESLKTKEGKNSFKNAINLLTEAIDHPEYNAKRTDKLVSEAYNHIVNLTKAETIKFKGDKKAFSLNLSDLLRDQVDLGRQFAKKSVIDNLDAFKKSSIKLVNTKSLMGLGIVIPIAMSMQAINRAITRKMYKTSGAPIYNDFGKAQRKEPTPEEKKQLVGLKGLASAGMIGLALASMAKKPNLKMFQFKGMFPTTDQIRWIATATMLSRFAAAEDKNELKETTIRSMAVFSGLYFFGDYVAKGVATLVEKIKPEIKLINRFQADDKAQPIAKRFLNWATNYKIKSFNEVAGVGSKNWRSLCQIANMGFSMIALGIVVPNYVRHLTRKNEEKRLAEEQKSAATIKINTLAPKADMPKAFGKITANFN